MTFRLTAAGVVLMAAAAAYAVLDSGTDVVGLAGWLRRHGHPGYAAWLGWVVLAPLVLAATAVLAPRTPWPWVAAVTAHLVSLVAALARAGHLVPGWSWALAGAAVVLGLASVVSAVGLRSRPAPERFQPS